MPTDKRRADLLAVTEVLRGLSDEQLAAFGRRAMEKMNGAAAPALDEAELVRRIRSTANDGGQVVEGSGLLHIDARSIDQIAAATVARKRPDNSIQLSLPGERSLPHFSHKSIWTIKDAAVMRRRMVDFYQSPYGLFSAFEILARRPFISEASSRAETRPYAARLYELWADPELLIISADDSFIDMMEAAAITAPTGPLDMDELLARTGVLFFQKERLLPELAKFPVRAIAWYVDDGYINMQVLIDGHHERDTPGEEGIEPPAENYAYLYVRNSLCTEVAHPERVGDRGMEALGILRSIAAIARSSLTRSENRTIEHREKKNGRVRNIHRDSVRVLSLGNPDHGRYELDAATGRKMRQHWVRGHWRSQWYARQGINKTIWIDGFVKGNPSIGTVTGEKVYTARAPKADPETRTSIDSQ